MSVLYITVGASLLIAVFFLINFLRSVKSGQFDDDYSPKVRILWDDEKAEPKENETEKK